jgi:hypothetical protein
LQLETLKSVINKIELIKNELLECLLLSMSFYPVFKEQRFALLRVIAGASFESVFYILEDEPSKLNAKRQLIDPRSIFRNYP